MTPSSPTSARPEGTATVPAGARIASPQLIITGARVRTTHGFVKAIGITGDRISHLGTTEDVMAAAGPGTHVIARPGGLVLPGFQDAHVHAPFAGRNRLRMWLNDLEGRQAYLDAIAAYAASHPDEPWILGGGWSMASFPGGLPRREDLDAVVPDRPVFLFNQDVHGAWLNSRALEIGGITAATPDPGDGRIERDPDGTPTGCLHEGAAYSYNDHVVPLPTQAEWEAAILEAQGHLHSLGITGWQDAWVTPATQLAYQSLADAGRLTARVVGALWWDRHRGLEQVEDLRTRREQARSAGAGGFHATAVKIMTDGVLENHTGALLQPYCDGCGGHTDNRGLAYIDRDLLAAAVTALDADGFQVHMHAIGDRAVRNALDAVAAARMANGMTDHRHHIAHLQLVHPDDIPRFASLGVIANCQAYWATNDEQMEELTVPVIGRDRADQQYPFASIHAAGARLAMGSDWSVSTADPLAQLEVAVTRAERGGPPLLPAERLPLTVALDAFTAGSAHVNHDDDAGSIALGRRADLAILDVDILADGFATPDAAPLADARVTVTVAAGRVVHE